jgi:hypothetical protein
MTGNNTTYANTHSISAEGLFSWVKFGGGLGTCKAFSPFAKVAALLHYVFFKCPQKATEGSLTDKTQ